MPALAVVAPFGFSFDPVRLLRAYREAGVTTAQFYRNEQNPPTVSEALKAAREAGVTYDSIHGVFGFHLDPSSEDAAHRKHCLDVYRAEGELAASLGGPMVVVHPSAWNPGMRTMTPAELEVSSAARWPRCDEFMHELAHIGAKLGVVYLIENQPYNCPLGHDPVEMARRVLAVKSPHIRMCLDTGHAHITTDLIDAMRRASPAIAYLHIHDNDAKQDDHRMPGDGTIDWAAFAAVLRETGNPSPRMLEVFYDEARVEELNTRGLKTKLAAALVP
jgi:sugar phosphate isomerase/epimerase